VIQNDSVRIRLENDLRYLGYQVSFASRDLEDLALPHPSLDLIISDKQLRGMDPEHLPESVSTQLRSLPVLYLARDQEDPEISSKGFHFPCTPRDLLLAIEVQLGGLQAVWPEKTESEVKYRTLWEQDVAANAITTNDGSLIDCNNTFLQMLGYDSVDELRKIPVEQLYLDPSDRSVMLETIRDAGKLEFYELKLQRRDGRAISCIANLFGTFNDKGELVQIHSHLIDNTRQKRLEERLRQAHKMEAIGRLTGGIAHDFNNLLTAILGYSELLLKQLKDEHLRRDLEQIVNAANRAGTLTRQLLAYSRRQVLQPTSLDLNSVLRDMEPMVRRVISSDIELEFSLDKNLKKIHADPGQIQQITLNMIVNGRDAMPRGGRLSIETRNLTLRGEVDHEGNPIPDGTYARLAVQDSGTGIEQSVVERMFDPYFTTKGLGKGSGLGLATVYGIVRQSNGFIRVQTFPGHGTLLEVLFPAIGTAEKDTSQPLGRKVLFLIADDKKRIRLLYSLLTQEGFTVLEPVRSSEFPARLSSLNQPVDLWILDASIARHKITDLKQLIRGKQDGARILSLRSLFGRHANAFRP